MPPAEIATAVVILAGGEATRLPGKLEIQSAGAPLVVRVFENVRAAGPVYVSASRMFPPEIDRRLECPIVIDRWVRRGPLGGLHTAFGAIREPRVFVTAGDAPFVTAATASELAQHWAPGIEAVVPVNAQGRLEPLCALYDRLAFLEAAGPALAGGSGGVASLVERLNCRRVRLSDERVFANVNTPADRRALLEV